ncbi:MAG TPA: glutamate racemase [Methylophilaceae bacterium]|nr:glutamate racemase [Methylophilaceae bacterium]
MSPLLEKRPIGIFDSGVGGISVLKHIRRVLPGEHLLYIADSRYAPYGNKSPQFICERAITLSEFLIDQGAKALVVACNTATAAAVSLMREKYSLPIIAMEPAVKPAAAATKTGVIGVLATSGTLKSAQFAGLLEHYGQHVQVVTQACHGLVECIERGELDAPSTKALLLSYIQPLLDANADTIVLGCTHYPFVRHLIEELVGNDIVLVDTGAAVAKHLKHRLQEADLLAGENDAGQVKFWTNSQAPDAKLVISQLWGEITDVSVLDVFD